MPRSLRMERENGVYHLINRGNYRQDLFVDEGTHQAFETCLFEACEKCGWVLEGFCVMTNHFHLVVRTPKGNLIYGMKWLQSTFANRYHRHRKVNGKLFQGRYKSLMGEESSYLRGLLHYVHLNPVRAGICSVSELKGYRWSSYWYLHQPRRRSAFMDFTHTLDSVSGAEDTPRGRQKYADYLAWVAADDAVQRELAFAKMSRRWALGSKDFKRGVGAKVITDSDSEAPDDGMRFEGRDWEEVNELIWERVLELGLSVVKKSRDDIVREAKSVDWEGRDRLCAKTLDQCAESLDCSRTEHGSASGGEWECGTVSSWGRGRETSYRDLIQRITE